jgi:hypothetical protein
MKVAELIEKLRACDPNKEVELQLGVDGSGDDLGEYSWEGGALSEVRETPHAVELIKW